MPKKQPITTKKRLIRLDEYHANRFEGEGLSIITLRRLCRQGELPAQKIGRQWFIDLDLEERMTGNPLVDSVLFG